MRIRKLNNSDNINHPKKAAKIASVLITIAAWLGEENFCPIICKTKARQIDPIEQYKSVPKIIGSVVILGKFDNSSK